MTNMQESFQDSINSLELTKDKMQNMVPSEVHVALKKRYQQVNLDRIWPLSPCTYHIALPASHLYLFQVHVPEFNVRMYRCLKNCLRFDKSRTRSD